MSAYSHNGRRNRFQSRTVTVLIIIIKNTGDVKHYLVVDCRGEVVMSRDRQCDTQENPVAKRSQ